MAAVQSWLAYDIIVSHGFLSNFKKLFPDSSPQKWDVKIIHVLGGYLDY